jgi:hypothetical protein
MFLIIYTRNFLKRHFIFLSFRPAGEIYNKHQLKKIGFGVISYYYRSLAAALEMTKKEALDMTKRKFLKWQNTLR